MKSQSRHSAPIFQRDNKEAIALTRVTLGGTGHSGSERESFIQDLVHKHPELIPMGDIEPAFTPLVSVCTELPTEAGYLDNLWITPAGGIILGECKLVKNPQARREVVVQALDYARAVSGWRFEQLEEAVRKALKKPTAKLWDFVSSEIPEPEFVDAVERRLRLGQFMILIIGDGIQEGVESLTNHLQLHAGMHAGLALVDLSIWQGLDGGLLIVPRVPMKTVLIERGIVRIDDSQRIRIEPLRIIPTQSSSVSRPQSQSETEFYLNLDQKRPGLAEKLRLFIDGLIEFGVRLEPGNKSIYLRWKSPDLGEVTIANIEASGKVWSQRALTESRKIGLANFAEDYLVSVAKIVGGVVKTYDSGSKDIVTIDNKGIDISTLLSSESWKQAVVAFTNGLSAAESHS